MTSERELSLRHMGFAFFGAICASLSHEINNVFATANELSGLLTDLFEAAGRGAPLDTERLDRVVRRIIAQIGRGQNHVKQLNRFAHTVDRPVARIDLNEAVKDIVALCQRFATLRRVTLEVEQPETPLWLEGSSFDVQHAVYRGIDILLAATPQGESTRIEVESHGDGARVSMLGGAPADGVAELDSRRDLLALLVEELGGELESEIMTGRPARLAMVLPRSMAAPPCDSADTRGVEEK